MIEKEVPEGYEIAPESKWPLGWKKEMGPWVRPTRETVKKALKEGEKMILERREELQGKLLRGDSEMSTVIIK